MMQSIWTDLRQQFAYGNMVTRIIIVNMIVFVSINLIKVVFFLAGKGVIPVIYLEIIRHLSISSDWLWTITHPWVLITATFVHERFFHIFWNMILLYWFGRIVGDFIGNKRVLPIYLLGGLVGALFYIIASQFMNTGSMAYGASAGVMALVLAAGTLSPDYEIRLLFIGTVKLKYIVAAMIFIDIISIPALYNTGGHIAHLGGALFGWIFIVVLRNGSDIGAPLNRLLNFLSDLFHKNKIPLKQSKSGRFTVIKGGVSASDRSNPYSDTMSNDSFEQKLDEILKKIKSEGYDNLTDEEKEFLFQASKK